MTEPILTFANVSKSFKEICALEEINFKFHLGFNLPPDRRLRVGHFAGGIRRQPRTFRIPPNKATGTHFHQSRTQRHGQASGRTHRRGFRHRATEDGMGIRGIRQRCRKCLCPPGRQGRRVHRLDRLGRRR